MNLIGQSVFCHSQTHKLTQLTEPQINHPSLPEVDHLASRYSMGPPTAQRLQALAKVSCNIFSTTFNPTASRNGNKILRQRLRGPALLDYYPTENVKLQTVIRAFPELGLLDEAEEIRKADVDARKRRMTLSMTLFPNDY